MKTTNAGFVKTVATFGLALLSMGANASAITVTYTTEGSQFTTGSPILNSTGGAAATLTFNPTSNTVDPPSNINYGIFSLLCESCTNREQGGGAVFAGFTFDLLVTVEDGAQGQFRGTSLGGTVFTDASTITINFVPLFLGPGEENALDGNFGPIRFTIQGLTPIVAPNSGNDPGETTVEGTIVDGSVPEPGTMALFGAGLLGMGIVLRKR
jgi:hypothetical protein